MPALETLDVNAVAEVAVKLVPDTVPAALTVLVDKVTPDTSTLPPVMLPVTDTVVPVNNVELTLAPPNTLPPVMLPVTLTVVPVKLVALTLAPPNTLPPVMLPVALINPGVVMLAPAIFAVTLSADTTFELRLRPAAFRLPPVMLPLTLTVVPVKLVALTLAPPNTLPPVILPVALINPDVPIAPLEYIAQLFVIVTLVVGVNGGATYKVLKFVYVTGAWAVDTVNPVNQLCVANAIVPVSETLL